MILSAFSLVMLPGRIYNLYINHWTGKEAFINPRPGLRMLASCINKTELATIY